MAAPSVDPERIDVARRVATRNRHIGEGATEEARSAIIQSLLSAASCLTLIPLQDVFGWTDRINTPAVVDDVNWTWRLPWMVNTWLDREDTVARADQLKAWTREAGR